MRKLLCIIGAAIVLNGCVADFYESPPPPASWKKSGVSPYETKNILAQCIYDTEMRHLPEHKVNRVIEACMISKGFRFY